MRYCDSEVALYCPLCDKMLRSETACRLHNKKKCLNKLNWKDREAHMESGQHISKVLAKRSKGLEPRETMKCVEK